MYSITFEKIDQLCQYMYDCEKSELTIKKYKCDILDFYQFLKTPEDFSKSDVVDYKKYLKERYKISSANSKIAAVNAYFKYFDYSDCILKTIKLQKASFRSNETQLTKEEYFVLLEAAKKKKDLRLFYILQTIAATGIRIGELGFITAEAVRSGKASIDKKGKNRVILIPGGLQDQLLDYIEEREIKTGPIFITRTGMAVDRNNVLHDMKKICLHTDINPEKVYPHNLRHLFALTYYNQEKDLSHLADILGHASINTTRIYTRTDAASEAAKLDQLGLVYKTEA